MTNKRVYLAGPDVFYPDAAQRATYLKDMCYQYKFEGIFPLDSKLGLKSLSKQRQAEQIYQNNIELIISCDAVMANMTPFRGPSMDVGTAFEMGYAAALGKPVVGYSQYFCTYNERVAIDKFLIEDFDMIDNLMVQSCTLEVFKDVEDCLAELHDYFKTIGVV